MMNKAEILEYAVKKIKKATKLHEFPHITTNGKWETTKDGYWTGGFWIGLLWWAYKFTGNEYFKQNAYHWLNLLEHRKISKTFDLGFIFYYSFVLGYKITGDLKLRKVALEAAQTQLSIFNEKLGFIYDEVIVEGVNYGKVLIDIMPNLSLLWWAYNETGIEEFSEVAYIHSSNTIEHLIRKDYSTYQGLLFDLEKYTIIKKHNWQGIGVDSCWSRGLSWGILGFIIAYATIKEIKFLEIAKKLGNYFIANLPRDFVPYWDFHAEIKPETLRDSSAAAISSTALLEIYKHSNEKQFKKAALNILGSLSTDYLASKNKDGILTHGCFYKQMNLGVDESLIWADYYFIEALMKVTKEII